VRRGEELAARRIALASRRAAEAAAAAAAEAREAAREAAAREALEASMAPRIQAAWKGHVIRRRIKEAQEAARFIDDDEDWDLGDVDGDFVAPSHLKLDEVVVTAPPPPPPPSALRQASSSAPSPAAVAAAARIASAGEPPPPPPLPRPPSSSSAASVRSATTPRAPQAGSRWEHQPPPIPQSKPWHETTTTRLGPR